MKKTAVSKLFLYRYRFLIGYIILGLAFTVLLFSLPIFANSGITNDEISSATSSYNLGFDAITSGSLIDLPYHLLQKFSIRFFGLSAYTIKLPSIIIGLLLGFLFILLLNRWFKSNVSLLASCLVVLSTPFLFLAGSGTPLIMIVFWPTLLLWLGSKIQGEKKPKPIYSILFAIALLFAIFTPYMLYFAIFCVLFVISQPHLRFIVKNLPKIPLILTALLVLGGITALGFSIYNRPDTILELLFSTECTIDTFFGNIGEGLTALFSWRTGSENVFLSPLVSLPSLALVLIGLFSTTKGFFASRNSIASLLLIFTLLITGFNHNAVTFFILPFSILIAHGIKYLLEKWYGLFPKNPYARISALIPLTLLFSFMLIPGLLQYIYGYHYNPNVVSEFSDTLSIIQKNLQNNETLLVSDHVEFYNILEDFTNLDVITSTDTTDADNLAILGKPEKTPSGYKLSRIITSAKSDNSDIIYLYTKKGD